MADPADKLIAAAAAHGLAPLGLVRKGRSRTWIDDHGWWLVNVEFQPSSHRVGCYLNVGDQHLWVERKHLTLGDMERPLGGSSFVAFDGDADAFGQALGQIVDAAADAVRRRRERHGDGIAALRRLVDGNDDLNAGIAAALLGDGETARSRLTGRIHQSNHDLAERYLGLSATGARALATSAIAATRVALRLPPVDVDWS